MTAMLFALAAKPHEREERPLSALDISAAGRRHRTARREKESFSLQAISRTSRLRKPDVRHHGGRQDDPEHKPVPTLGTVRVTQRRRESAEGEKHRSIQLVGVVCAGTPGKASGMGSATAGKAASGALGGWARHKPALQVQ